MTMSKLMVRGNVKLSNVKADACSKRINVGRVQNQAHTNHQPMVEKAKEVAMYSWALFFDISSYHSQNPWVLSTE